VGGVETATVRKCRIFALQLSGFANNYYDEDRARATNATTTPSDQSILTFTAAARAITAFGALIAITSLGR
jgi:hypothetical protein